jgi:hypothetical protein
MQNCFFNGCIADAMGQSHDSAQGYDVGKQYFAASLGSCMGDRQVVTFAGKTGNIFYEQGISTLLRIPCSGPC